jgi:5-methylcytosine-specific restriction endonuclease McrA
VRILRSGEERAANPTSGMKSKSRKKRSQRKAKQTKFKMTPEDSRTISDDLKDRVWRRDQGMCQANYKLDSRFDKNTGEICGSNENLEFDHIVPFSKGGKTTYRNLQLLCRNHNRIKSDREI